MWESKLFLTSHDTTRLNWTIQNILLAANPSTAFLQKANWPGKNLNIYIYWWINKFAYVNDQSKKRPKQSSLEVYTDNKTIYINIF